MSIRSAVPEDAGALHVLAAETFPLACPPGISPDDVAAFIDANLSELRMAAYLADAARDLLVADVDGVLVGYTMLVLADPEDADVAAVVLDRPTAEVSKCYVAADHHGTGLAGELLSATVDTARRRGAASAWLGVNRDNLRANAFYERNGFALVGTKHFAVGSRHFEDFVRYRPLRG